MSIGHENNDFSIIATSVVFLEHFESFIISFSSVCGTSCVWRSLKVRNDFVDIACQFSLSQCLRGELDDSHSEILRVIVTPEVTKDLLNSMFHSPVVVLSDTARFIQDNNDVSLLDTGLLCIMPRLNIVC